MTKPNDSKTMKKSIPTRHSRRLIAEMGCPVVKQPKLSQGTKSIAKTLWERSRMATNMQISIIRKKLRPTAKVFKIKTCNKHITACNEKREKSPKLFFKTIGCNIYQAPPWSRIPPNNVNWGKFGMEGGWTKVKLLR